MKNITSFETSNKSTSYINMFKNAFNDIHNIITAENISDIRDLEQTHPHEWSNICNAIELIISAQLNSTREYSSNRKDVNGNAVPKTGADGNIIRSSNKDVVYSIMKKNNESFEEIKMDVFEHIILHANSFIFTDNEVYAYNKIKISIKNHLIDQIRAIKNLPSFVSLDADDEDNAGMNDHRDYLADPRMNFSADIVTDDYIKNYVLPQHVEMFIKNNKADRLLAYLSNVAKSIGYEEDIVKIINEKGYYAAYKEIINYLAESDYSLNIPVENLTFKINNKAVTSKIFIQWAFRASEDVRNFDKMKGITPAA